MAQFSQFLAICRIEEMLQSHNMQDTPAKDVPMDPKFEVSSHDSPATEGEKREIANQQEEYLTLMGELLWVSKTCRSDISAAVAILADTHTTHP